jgi:hypothetical protein
MKKFTFTDFALKILEETNSPMTAQEIWDYGVEKGWDKELGVVGKTPLATLGARLYTDRKYVDKIGARPAKFVLKGSANNIDIEKLQEKPVVKENKKQSFDFLEKDLHPVLVYYARNYLKVHAKTINHSKSNKNCFGQWLHPDIVGCYFPFEEWDSSVAELNSKIGNSSLKLYSFELKRELNFSNLRECFFQAVSNSTWANEGYLAAETIDNGVEFQEELNRLSLAYGIGIIQLDRNNPDDSTIMYPASARDVLDWLTINKITEMNTDFRNFINGCNACLASKDINSKYFDKVLEY